MSISCPLHYKNSIFQTGFNGAFPSLWRVLFSKLLDRRKVTTLTFGKIVLEVICHSCLLFSFDNIFN